MNTTQSLNLHTLLSNVNEFKVFSRIKEKLQKLSHDNEAEGMYDLSSLETELKEAENDVYAALKKAQQFSEKHSISTLNKYTIIIHHDYDDSSIDLFVCEDIIEDEFNNYRHILTDKVLKVGSSNASSIDELCGDWIDYHLYIYYITWFKK